MIPAQRKLREVFSDEVTFEKGVENKYMLFKQKRGE